MYYVNKIAFIIVNPVLIGVAMFAFASIFVFTGLRFVKRNESGRAVKSFKIVFTSLLLCSAWFYFWSTGLFQSLMGRIWGLDEYRLVEVEKLPQCDAIVVLGGGMGIDTNICQYACLSPAAARPWHAARLWKAGKASIIIVSGTDARNTDGQFLLDLGVPPNALLYDEEARNTEENAVFVEKLMRERLGSSEVSVLLVTSASHMKRAMMIFRKLAPKFRCFPVVTDYGSVNWFAPVTWKSLMPSTMTLSSNLVVWKECLGILGYRLRGF